MPNQNFSTYAEAAAAAQRPRRRRSNPVRWPERWEWSRVRPGLYKAEGHTIEKLYKSRPGWGLWCTGDKYIGSRQSLAAIVEFLDEHLTSCDMRRC